jgi:membrane protease YdiL (CAAX protease family)
MSIEYGTRKKGGHEPEMETTPRNKILTFLILTALLSSPFYYLIISSGEVAGGGLLYVLGLMWAPGFSGLLTRFLFQRDLREIGWGWGRIRYQFSSYLIPIGAGIVVYGLAWAVGAAGFSKQGFSPTVFSSLGANIVFLATVGVVISCVFSMGEEVGWRGLLVPELAKVAGFTKTSLLTAVIWSVYHYPVLIFADYHSSAPIWYSLVMFTLLIVGLSFISTWLRLKSGSVWTGVILHASHNQVIQRIFDPLTLDLGFTDYLTTEFGAGLAVLYLVGGFWCWIHRNELPRS